MVVVGVMVVMVVMGLGFWVPMLLLVLLPMLLTLLASLVLLAPLVLLALLMLWLGPWPQPASTWARMPTYNNSNHNKKRKGVSISKS